MRATWLDPVFFSAGRVRPIWRLALFFSTFGFLAIAGQLAVSVVPAYALNWSSMVAIIAAALVAGWAVLSQVDGRPFGALGFYANPAGIGDTVRGLAIGSALITLAVLLLLLTDSAAFRAEPGTAPDYLFFLFWTFLYYALAAAFEEALFRGYPFQVLVEWIGPWVATIAASLLFALVHARNPNVTPLALANIFLAGALLSIAYLRTRSLWFATGIHVGWNWTMATVFDLPVSGLGFDTPLYTGFAIGEGWWTGESFGPEAGLVGTIAMIVGLVWLLRTGWIKPSPEILRLQPIVDQRPEMQRFG